MAAGVTSPASSVTGVLTVIIDVERGILIEPQPYQPRRRWQPCHQTGPEVEQDILARRDHAAVREVGHRVIEVLMIQRLDDHVSKQRIEDAEVHGITGFAIDGTFNRDGEAIAVPVAVRVVAGAEDFAIASVGPVRPMVSMCSSGNGIGPGWKAFCASRSSTEESLPIEYSITGLLHSATTSRRMWMLSASSSRRWERR